MLIRFYDLHGRSVLGSVGIRAQKMLNVWKRFKGFKLHFFLVKKEVFENLKTLTEDFFVRKYILLYI